MKRLLLFLLFPTLLFAQEPKLRIDYDFSLFSQWQAKGLAFDGKLVIPDTADLVTSMSWIPQQGAEVLFFDPSKIGEAILGQPLADTMIVIQNDFNYRICIVLENDTTILEPDTLRFRRIIRGKPEQRFAIIKETRAMYRLIDARGRLVRVYNTRDPESILVAEKFRKDTKQIEERLKKRKHPKRQSFFERPIK